MPTGRLVCLGLIAICTGALAGEPAVTFAAAPTVSRADGRVTVAFAVSAKTDVEVAVLDARGKVVRHLAAGVLGAESPPPAPLKPGLAQSIAWDGKDDRGRPVPGAGNDSTGPFSVRVRAGIRASLDRMIGDNPAQIESPCGLAVGPDGTVYVHHTSFGFGTGSSHGTVTAFDRNGAYLRTVAPYAANLSDEKLKGVKRLELEPGVKIPFVYNAETRGLIPGLGGEPELSRGVVTGDGRIILCGTMGIQRGKSECRLVSLNADGSIPSQGLLGPGFGATPAPSLAISPDGGTIYAVGVVRGAGKNAKPANAVYAMKWGDKEPRALIQAGLDDPRSVAVDAAGNLYVADKGNGRVAVFKPDGAALGALKTESPERVEVNPRTGAVYVLGGAGVDELRKYDSWKSTAPTASAKLPASRSKDYTALIALDHSAQPPTLWVSTSGTKGRVASFRLLRIEDQGASFGKQVEVTELPGNNAAAAIKPTDLTVVGENLYVWAQRGWNKPLAFNAVTGQAVGAPPLPPQKMSWGVGFGFEAGADGNYYVATGWPKICLYRFDAGFKALPYPGLEGGAFQDLGGPRTRLRGMCADARGNAYVLRQKDDPGGGKGGEPYGDANAVAMIGPDGKMINDRLVDSDIRSLNSVRVDPAGNIYLALGARAGGALLPKHLAGKLPDSPQDPDAELGYNYYPLMYGSIVKFSPRGGEIRLKGEGAPASFLYDGKVFIKGAEWSWFGASAVPSWVHGGFQPNICMCESPRFDVDGFGRCFFPDACGFRVGILDTAGNLIGWFGRYGNRDSAGKGSRIPEPAIPIGWAQAVTVDGEAVFVGDRLNGRILRVRLGSEAEATCAIK